LARIRLDHLLDRHTRRLEALVEEREVEAAAEAAERKRRLAFDPGAEADKVRRYEDIAVRRMSRVCDDLIKLRRSGALGGARDSRPAAANGLEEADSIYARAAPQLEPASRAVAESEFSKRTLEDIEHEAEAEAAGQHRVVERPDLESSDDGVDDWDEIITIT